MAYESIGQQLLDVPFPDMVKSMGLSIAQAQYELDMVSVRMAQLMAGAEYEQPNPDYVEGGEQPRTILVKTKVNFDGKDLSLLELGFTPNFYQFVDTIIEIKISISIKTETDYRFSNSQTSANFSGAFLGFYNKGSLQVSTVSASFASKYQYSAEGSSLLRTKLVPVPPPAILQDRIRKLVDKTN